MTISNPDRHVYLSKRDLALKYRSAISKLKNAREELEYLEEGGFGPTNHLGWALAELDEAIANAERSQQEASEKYGFTPARGIGPGDWEAK